MDHIKDLSQYILNAYEADGTLPVANESILTSGCTDDDIDTNCECDKLLQEFHRFDEDLSVKGKWQGGSVTGVCRGWGTSKFMSLEAIYHISDSVLNIQEQVEVCIEEEVDRFNRDPENFVVDQEPCFDELDGVQFFGGLTYTQVVDDIRRKFECLLYSFLVSSNRCPSDSSCGIAEGQTV